MAYHERNHRTTTMWPGKNVLLWRWLLFYILHFYRLYRALYLVCSCFMDVYHINAHSFFPFPLRASQWDSAYNHHIEAYVCFLSNRISFYFLALTQLPVHPSFVVFHWIWFDPIFFRLSGFFVGGKSVIYSVNCKILFSTFFDFK